MKRPIPFILIFFLAGSIVRYSTSEISRIIKPIHFLQIFTIGLLSGVLFMILTDKFRNRNK
jgi:hypothetical protein